MRIWRVLLGIMAAVPAMAASSEPLSLLGISAGKNGTSLSVPMQIVILLTLMTLLPAAVMSITPFLRIVIVLHFLRQALGTQSTPSNQVLLGLADGGGIIAGYSNGDQVMVGQVAVASVRNPDTLLASGNNNFQLSARTATPSVGTPGTGGRGTIVGGSIEASTVDIAREFTNLIVYQRGYEANSKVVTTSDTLSQDTINLIR